MKLEALPTGSVVAVVVTRHRRELLADSLKMIGAQTRAPDHLVVVDNGPDEPVATSSRAARSHHLPALAPQPRWRGRLRARHAARAGAGRGVGLAAPTTTAARPTRTCSRSCWTRPRRATSRRSPRWSPTSTARTKLAFPLRRGLTWKRGAPELGTDFLPGIASLFNGALFRASTLDVVGVPDYRLFFRGDEVEIHRRLVRSGLPFGTSLRVAYLHPDGSDEFKPMLGGRLHAQDPENEIKRYYTYRNRGYLLSQPGMRKIGMLELIRFGLYFIGTKRDPKAFMQWLKLVRQGQQERFFRK